MKRTERQVWGVLLAWALLTPTLLHADEEKAKGEGKTGDGKRVETMTPDDQAERARTTIVKIKPRGEPGSRTGGGTRGPTNLPAILLLAPGDLPDVGLTSRAQPTLSWYLSSATDARIDFTLVDDDSVLPLLQITVATPVSPGIHALRLSDYGITLETVKTHHWFVALVPDPIRRSNDVVASAAIRRVPIPPEVQRELASSEGRPAYEILEKNGFWYDAFAEVSDAIVAKPSDRSRRVVRAALLERAGFDTTEPNH